MGLGTGDANAERQNGSEMSRQMAPSADCTAVMTAQLTRAQFAAPAADVSQSGIVVAIALEIVYRMFMFDALAWMQGFVVDVAVVHAAF